MKYIIREHFTDTFSVATFPYYVDYEMYFLLQISHI